MLLCPLGHKLASLVPARRKNAPLQRDEWSVPRDVFVPVGAGCLVGARHTYPMKGRRVLTRSRLNELFALRTAAKAAVLEVEKEFERLHGFSPYDREKVGRRWVVREWNDLYEAKPAVIAYEAADRALAPDEREALRGMIELEWEYDDAPRLDLLLDLLEARQRHGTH